VAIGSREVKLYCPIPGIYRHSDLARCLHDDVSGLKCHDIAVVTFQLGLAENGAGWGGDVGDPGGIAATRLKCQVQVAQFQQGQ